MKKLTLFLALIAAAAVCVPGTATAAKKKKPKTPIYKISGAYKSTHIVNKVCHPFIGGELGTVAETTRMTTEHVYSGNTKNGTTITSTRSIHHERGVTGVNEYIHPYSIMGQPETITRKLKGSEVLTGDDLNKGRGFLSYKGLEAENTSHGFKLPAKKGKSETITVSDDVSEDIEPDEKCSSGYIATVLTGHITITRIN